jgi:hypothetical protein
MPKLAIGLAAALGISLSGAVSARTGPAPEVEQRLKALAAARPSMVELSRIGMSRQGRPLHLALLADKDAKEVAPADRPALLIVAGAAGNHRVGVEAALGVAEKLAGEHADQLKTFSVYVVPCLNPDSFAFNAEPGRPVSDYSRTIAPFDADHDGRVNEDPGEDLNGDGMVTMMRITDPPPGSSFKAEYVADPENAKVLRKADPAKGEVPRYALIVEGSDNDGDGKFNEDGPGGSAGGGVDLDLNSPYRWPEFSDGAGPYPFSEPESLALARWLLDHRNVVAVVFYGPHDTLVNVPQAGRFDDAGGIPLGIENGDKPYYDEISKVFKDITKMTGAPGVDPAGSLHGWAYAMAGVYSFSTPVWVRPDLVKSEPPRREGENKNAPHPDEGHTPPPGAPPNDAAPDDAGFTIMPAALILSRNQPTPQPTGQPVGRPPGQPVVPAGGGQPGGRGGGAGGRFPGGRGGFSPPAAAADTKPGSDSDDLKWIKYSDEKRGGAGFTDWKPFDHPQLGPVEIGGFVPGFRVNPPDEDLPRLIDEQSRFASALLDKFPRLTAPAARVSRLAPGLWRVSVRVVNRGFLPVQSAMGAKTRRVAPTRLSIDQPLDAIVSGQKIMRYPVIGGSGGGADAEWIVRSADGSTVKVTFNPVIGPAATLDVKLEEAPR